MEIRRWQCYVAINCVLIIPLLSAKPFSINEALAAESKTQKTIIVTPSPTSAESNTRFSLNKALRTLEPLHDSKTHKTSKYYSRTLRSSKLPSFKFNKLSHLKSPLKFKSIRDLLRPFQKRKRQAKKREIYKHDKIDEKYFPLFKNLGLLFDNLLNESGESYEVSKKKYKRKYPADKKSGIGCACAGKSDSERGESRSHKKAIVPTRALSSEKSAVATSPTTDPALGNFSSVGQDKDVPLLLPRNSPRSWRDNYGHSARSRPAFHRSIERDITRNSRNSKHHARNGKYSFSTESHEEDTDSAPRNDATSDESRGRIRGNPELPYDRNEAYERTSYPKSKKTHFVPRGLIYELPRENQLETRRNETESKNFLSKHIRGVRGPLSENQIGDISGSIQSEENYEEGYFRLPLNSTSDKRFSIGSGATSRENQEIRSRDETVVSINDLSDLDQAHHRAPKVNTPSVTIIDGYSVARDKNGQNKMLEKAIRIHAN